MLKQVERVRTCAHLTDEVTELERKNRELARSIAGEAIVLLENDGTLPLETDRKVALFGVGATHTVKGGSGSGEVNERYSVSIYEGMKNAGFDVVNADVLERYAKKARKAREDYEKFMLDKAGFLSFEAINMSHMKQGYDEVSFGELREADYREAKVCIYVLSRMSGEGADRELREGDYFLSGEEEQNLRWCASHYLHVVLVFNAGGPVDLSSVEDLRFSAILNIGMLGEEGGNAFADVMSGNLSPSGHLTGTWAKKYEDIPFGEHYSGLDADPKTGDYREDIYVGYRYFERFRVTPRFYFGQGESYTSFETRAERITAERALKIQLAVKNTGDRPGKCVPQVYVSVPEGRLMQPEAVLAGFVKTKLLAAGEETKITVTIPWHYFASFDEERGAELMEAGRYVLYLGKDIRRKETIGAFDLEREVVFAERKHICPEPAPVEKLAPVKRKEQPAVPEELVFSVNPDMIGAEEILPAPNPMDEFEEEARRIVEKIPLKELPYLLTGDGCADMVMPARHNHVVPGATGYSTSRLTRRGLCCFACCDGPAGLRFMRTSVVRPGADKIRIVEPALDMLHFMPKAIRLLGNGKKEDGQPLYMFATAFPTGTALAQTWNEELVQQMGDAVGAEMEEYGVTVWLAPGMNIHRNPLCGRNYEYYSEDPLLAGKTGAAMIRGVQSHRGCYATIKHFFCNNQENQRQWTSANVGERALREIYLRGFGIAVKEAGCRALMSSYNRINGVWSGVCRDALTTVLREEWGFKGIVVTDWDASHEGLEAEKSIDAGITMLMAGDGKQRKAIYQALKDGRLDGKVARERAMKNVQVMLLHQSREQAEAAGNGREDLS